MNKNTKMILGVGAVAIVGYLVWKQMSKPKAAFANLTAPGGLGSPSATICCGHTAEYPNKNSPSGKTYKCCNGEFALDSEGKTCAECDKIRAGAAPKKDSFVGR